MRISLNSIAIAALLGSIPFASVVRSAPTGEYIDIVEVSKRAFPLPGAINPFRHPDDTPSPPSSPPSNPFRHPDDTPSPPGTPGGAAGWRGIADDKLNIEDFAQNAMRIKGQKLIMDLELAITRNSDSKVIRSVPENGYKGQGLPDERPDLDISNPQRYKPYSEFGIDTLKAWRKDDITKPGSKTIVKTYEDPKQKAMIISMSFNRDEDAGGKMQWSEMVMSNWAAAAKQAGVATSDLKYIIRNNIQTHPTTTKTPEGTKFDLETQSAIKGAFTAMDKKTSETLMLDFKTTDPKMLQQVSILSAQTHVARVLQMLKDYRGEFDNLQISKLHLQTRDHPQTDHQFNIIIELGK